MSIDQKIAAVATVTEGMRRSGNEHRVQVLQAMQNTVTTMRDCYELNSGQYEALLLASEALGLAWSMLGLGHDGGYLEPARGALREVEHRVDKLERACTRAYLRSQIEMVSGRISELQARVEYATDPWERRQHQVALDEAREVWAGLEVEWKEVEGD